MSGRWNCENRQQALFTFTDLIGKFQEILQQNEAESTRIKVIPASEYIYIVHNKEKHFIVYLMEKKCSCNAFQLDEIPCVYACAVLDSKNFKKGPYCSDLYKPKTILRTCDIPVYPLPHKDDWIISSEKLVKVVLPPKYKRPLEGLQRRIVKSPDEICLERKVKIVVVHADVKGTIGIHVVNTTNDKSVDVFSY
ncbi:uncharacterized protein LOC124887063 [Capsicum annuum]|uniref:uncharacterized protein LOC124887063 n=1 Tax=Capsicum annuum TaxID=4072 RepID=UPI001FB153E9|nr:uncharacterized protein LOC124887063 [Capsicum annuum]